MKCPKRKSVKNNVSDSRKKNGKVFRTRQCEDCLTMFNTVEKTLVEIDLKNFAYFEDAEGGMEERNGSDLRGLRGWMNEHCKEEDEALSQWMATAKIGEKKDHRLGCLVRLTDKEER